MVPESVLVVCTGNICRSPYGEYRLRKLVPGLTVTSAGLEADRNRLTGKPADSVAVRIAAESQIDLRRHRAKQVTEELVNQNEIILVMEQSHKELLCDAFPHVARKVFLFSHWIGDSSIEDPYRRGELSFRLAFNQIDDAAEAWARKWLT